MIVERAGGSLQVSRDVKYKSYRFSTWSYRSFIWLYDAFYGSGKKRVPANTFLEQYLTPQALAIWTKDDGTYHKRDKTVVLSTEGFLKQDVERLRDFLMTKYGFVCSLHKRKKGYNLYLRRNSTDKFITLVRPYFCPSMLYKLGL
jgi:hypothetical protein